MSGLVHRNTVVTLDYSVTDSDGQVVDDGRNPMNVPGFTDCAATLEGVEIGYSIGGEGPPRAEYVFRPELVVRGSTGAAPHRA